MAPKVAEYKRKEQEAIGSDSYYEEDPDSDGPIGKGYDEDSEIDLTEFTE